MVVSVGVLKVTRKVIRILNFAKYTQNLLATLVISENDTLL